MSAENIVDRPPSAADWIGTAEKPQQTLLESLIEGVEQVGKPSPTPCELPDWLKDTRPNPNDFLPINGEGRDLSYAAPYADLD
jgi:hypothetical protein